jgi:hypothetical protein
MILKSSPPAQPAQPGDPRVLAAVEAELAKLIGDPLRHQVRTELRDLVIGALGKLDGKMGLRQPSEKLTALLRDFPYLKVCSADGTEVGTWQTSTELLWRDVPELGQTDKGLASRFLQSYEAASLKGWRLPSKPELLRFAQRTDNPHHAGYNWRIKSATAGASCYWLTDSGGVDLDYGIPSVSQYTSGYTFACCPVFTARDPVSVILQLRARRWRLESFDGQHKFGWDDGDFVELGPQDLSPLQVLRALERRGWWLHDAEGRSVTEVLKAALLPLLESIDWRASRLPKLEPVQFTDRQLGLWELWKLPAERAFDWGWVARDPAADLRSHPVAIDFGTSSTVVAVYDGRQRSLLRIGVRDYYAAVEPQQFENPTVIECLDLAAFEQVWGTQAYRPAHDWDWMRVGHEARASWRDNPGDTQVLSSILPRLKGWVLRAHDGQPPLKLTDRLHGRTIDIAAPRDRRPLAGAPLQVRADDPFDPIEFYAYQLGMAINWRKRGIFCEYYLSFPVKFERAVKDRVLASFMRGLQRSLPPTLVAQGEVLSRFKVRELASEPAAYAAAALPHLGFEPSEGGLAYAVFDFGGGTADFDFGLWRTASAAEEDEGYEAVFEHLASAGDNFLGGENLLEHLAYRVLRANLAALRGKLIHFTRPLDAEPMAGEESFVQPTQAAQTNMVMLANRLRAFWEGARADALEGQIKLELLDAQDNKQAVELALDGAALDAYLSERIGRGVELFLAEMRRAFADWPAERGPIHVLLAGNASRSRHVQAAFDPQGPAWGERLARIWGHDGRARPRLEVHPPLPIDAKQPYAPTAKTGVALGLLRLAPGMGSKLVDHVRTRHDGEAPFAYFVGRLRRGTFQPALDPDTPYQAWRELGPVSDGAFNLYFTASPRARLGMLEGDAELLMERINWPEAKAGARAWARARQPWKIELGLGEAGSPPAQGQALRELALRRD